jgi:hypothetical protein
LGIRHNERMAHPWPHNTVSCCFLFFQFSRRTNNYYPFIISSSHSKSLVASRLYLIVNSVREGEKEKK